MSKLDPHAIIATWVNAESTRGYHLQANGDLVEISRASIGSAWSPPSTIGELRLSNTIEPLRALLDGLTSGDTF